MDKTFTDVGVDGWRRCQLGGLTPKWFNTGSQVWIQDIAIL